MSQTEKEIYGILDRKVFFVRESMDKEKELFPDKKEGGFFTFALESGQKFVANFSEEGIGRKKNRIMTFRPLNKMVKGLKEFSWQFPHFPSLNCVDLNCTFENGIPDEEKAFCMGALISQRGELGFKQANPNLFMIKALSVSSAYFLTLKAQKRLSKVLISEIQRKQKTR